LRKLKKQSGGGKEIVKFSYSTPTLVFLGMGIAGPNLHVFGLDTEVLWYDS